MRTLVTGARGFIGTHLCKELEVKGHEVIKCDVNADRDIVFIDIMDIKMIQDVIEEYQPDVLINLAGQANVGLSWNTPQITVQLNTVGLINILEAVRLVDPNIRVIAVGSSDEYGNLGKYGVNVTENTPVKPVTPYAISKLAQELFSQLYVRSYGLNICMIRLFNLGGAGQEKGYLISDFASGIAEIEYGKKCFLSVGNLDSARDITHVKDACRAIRLIAEKGRAGEVYNISSGTTHRTKKILEMLIHMSSADIDVRVDPVRMRPSDTPVVCGNHDKLTAHTGWQPELGIMEILTDALNYWREKIGVV